MSKKKSENKIKVKKEDALLQLLAFRSSKLKDVELKQFSTYVDNPEEVIASALYEAHQYSLAHGVDLTERTAAISTFCSDNIYYEVINGHKEDRDVDIGIYDEVEHFDHQKIADLFDMYVEGRATPVDVPNAVACMTEKVADRDNLPVVKVNPDYRDYGKVCEFIDKVTKSPKKYTDETVAYVKYRENGCMFIFSDEKYLPKDVKLDERKETCQDVYYYVSGVIDGKLVKTSFCYDIGSVHAYGEPHLTDITNHLHEAYLEHFSKAEYDCFLSGKRISKNIPEPVNDETEYDVENEGIEKD